VVMTLGAKPSSLRGPLSVRLKQNEERVAMTNRIPPQALTRRRTFNGLRHE
jgi:hypothetical protein